MSAGVQPPEELAGLVQSGKGYVRFEVPASDGTLFAFGCASGIALSLALFIAVFLLILDPTDVGRSLGDAIAMSGCPSLVLMTVTTLLGSAWSAQPRELVITSLGFTFGGRNPPVVAVGTVRLTGVAGEPMVLTIGDRELLTCEPVPSGTRGWTYEGVGWLGARIAELTEQELVDERPREAWEAWSSDPTLRARQKWSKDLEANEQRYPQQHHMKLQQPTHQEDSNGLEVRIATAIFSEEVIGIDATRLTNGRIEWPLKDIQAVRVMYEPRSSKSKGRQYSARLEVLVHDQEFLVAKVPVDSDPRYGGEMAWVAQRLRQAIELARPTESRGTVEDIPEELRNLRGAKVPRPE